MNHSLSKPLFWLLLLWAVFIVYGSLIPFEWRGVGLLEGPAVFRHIRWLDLGIQSRADWTANALLYLPLTFLWLAWWHTRHADGQHLGASVRILLTACTLAVGIEFLQVYDAPRTVSLNDIAAEAIGSAIGVILWLWAGPRLLALARAAVDPSASALKSAFILYVIGLGVFGVIPFDFVSNRHELVARLHDPALIRILPNADGSLPRLAALLLAKAIAFLPIGVLMSLSRSRRPVAGAVEAALVAAGFSLLLQFVKLFEYSGTATVAAIALAAAGAAIGYLAARTSMNVILGRRWRLLRSFVLAAVPLYVAALTVLYGWWHGTRPDAATISLIISEMHWAPLYYQYYTTEMNALASVLNISLTFGVIGVIRWVQTSKRPDAPVSGLLMTGIIAFLVEAAIEVGGLLLAARRPDPSNPLIACAGAVFMHLTCAWFVAAVRYRQMRETSTRSFLRGHG